jgi:hypothetical protein
LVILKTLQVAHERQVHAASGFERWQAPAWQRARYAFRIVVYVDFATASSPERNCVDIGQ